MKIKEISIIGLGYVGLPIAVAFAMKGLKVVGFDINNEKIELYRNGIDPTKEVGNEKLSSVKGITFTNNVDLLKNVKFHIVAVPTPINADKTPNLTPVIKATETLGKQLTKGSIVVFESTVFPGVTEDYCVPILEKESGLKCGIDFKVGYSPERINPGDEVHRLENIIKVVSGMDEESLEIIASVYEMVIDAGVYKASSIRVAEAAKVIENTQRDINIAFMNELSMIFDKLNIDTKDVLDAAGTKWNFLKFEPGLVGGHCIGVDPYYLTYKAEEAGYHPQIILSGRRINDNMGKYVAEHTIKTLIKAGKLVKDAKIAIMGFTFKENCPDTRNTRVIDIYEELLEYGITPVVYDPVADEEEMKLEYNIDICDKSELADLDVIIVAVKHDEFKKWSLEELDQIYKNDKILIDIKGLYNRKDAAEKGYLYWRL